MWNLIICTSKAYSDSNLHDIYFGSMSLPLHYNILCVSIFHLILSLLGEYLSLFKRMVGWARESPSSVCQKLEMWLGSIKLVHVGSYKYKS